ncbi:archaellin/type IV pilin N-terminal domain-containing protein [uncultured Methanoregula sp.]|uniref:archaellin/type IV pilin N-terminal domain-containing protein n=1 Tax=uncultured Methanoregula sp. TaxID=1005933 RepID=UPI002AABAAC7|nr:archaellin/type IV pilin N-terminal domain-containing protein [uncultured Methanoregula sp.]
MKSFKNENAFTGLEAAIVLIAFVVVAAVFSYVVLGAGFFTTQKSQEVVHTGVQQASSTLEIVGNVYGVGTAATSITMINFSAALAPGGTPVDFDKVVITYSNSSVLETLSKVATKGATVSTGKWGIVTVQNEVTNDNVLEKGEQFDITAMPTNAILKNDQFQLEIKPAVGAALGISRTAPASIQAVNILY